MSIAVALEDLAATLERFPWAFLVTVDDDQRAHLLSVPTRFEDGDFVLAAGRSTRSNADKRPNVTMVFPPAGGAEMSLIVDGIASVTEDAVRVTPSQAVLHRPALR